MAVGLTILPLFILWVLVKLLPPWPHDACDPSRYWRLIAADYADRVRYERISRNFRIAFEPRRRAGEARPCAGASG